MSQKAAESTDKLIDLSVMPLDGEPSANPGPSLNDFFDKLEK